MMLEERFGPMGNERYKDYLKDIHASGAEIIEPGRQSSRPGEDRGGRVELSFTAVNLNALVASCITLMQPQAARERIVMRTSFAQRQVSIMADEHSMRQIVLNIVSNAIQFTDAADK